jgi:citrate lyase beta subunit
MLGYACKLAIHPTQIAVINCVFTPRSDQIATAGRVVAAFDQAGGGSCQVDGRMVDVPVVKCARRTVTVAARAAASSPIELREY